jgi:hypothetical protein
MAMFTLREKHVPIVPCLCARCRELVLAMPDGERRWEQRKTVALRLRRTLRQRLVDARLDECDVAEARRERRARIALVAMSASTVA